MTLSVSGMYLLLHAKKKLPSSGWLDPLDAQSPFGSWVAIAPLDEVLSDLANACIFFVSIDTEGNELAVLKGAQHRAYVLAGSTSGESDTTIINVMSENGYESLMGRSEPVQ